MTESNSEENNRKITRRGFIKWTTALGVAGAAVIGIGAGYGSDLLLRPTAEKTTTQTQTATKSATTTVTQPAQTSTVTTASTTTSTATTTATTTKTVAPPVPSLKPPLSPEIQARVDAIVAGYTSLHQGETIKYTTCSGTQCFRYCLLGVRVKNGVVTGFEPDNTINANKGMEDQYITKDAIMNIDVQSRSCPMSYGFMKVLYDPNRVIYPMQRVGDRGSGKWNRITMDQAITLTTQWLQDTKAKYGPLSIWHDGYSCSQRSSFPLAGWYNAGIAGWDCHSSNGWGQPANWVGNQGGSQDYRNQSMAKLIVIWGANPVVVQQGEWGWYLRMFREQGIPIIVIDHRYSWSAESVATQFIPIRPGTDAAMMIAMANVIFKQNLVDTAFVSKWVEPTGFAKWKDYVLGNTAGPDGAIDRTPEWAEKICGVPAATIRELAVLWGNTKGVNLEISGGVWRTMFGENGARGAMYLQAITGNIGIVGAAITQYNGPSGSAVDANGVAAVAPSVDPKRAAVTYTPPTKFAEMNWAKAIVLKPQYDAGKITKEWFYGKIGLKLDSPIANPQMLIFNNNPAITTVDVNTCIKALKSVERVVVFGQEYKDTARLSDLILPMSYMQFEGRQPSVGNSRMTAGQPDILFRSVGKHFFYMQKCVDPPGDVQAEDYIWTQIANKLGIGDKYNPLLYQCKSQAEWDATQEQLHQAAYEAWAAKDGVKQLNPPSWADFQKKPVWRWPSLFTPRFNGQDTIAKGTSPFTTASKLMEFVSPYLSNGPAWLAANDYYPVGSGMSYGPGNLAPMAEWQSGAGDVMHSPDVTKFPILVSTPHSHYRQHSWLDSNPALQDNYRHATWISVADAQARGIKDGDLVHVYNDQGEMIMPAYVTSRVVPGSGANLETAYYIRSSMKTALMPDGIDTRGCCNLICRDIDLPYTVVGYYNCHGLVQVEKVQG